MNIFHKIVLHGLKKNRTRTLVTVIGVALSAALITGVSTLIVSLQAYMINGAVIKYGDWQVAFPEVDSAFIQEQTTDERIESVISFENIGYADLAGGENPDKPYLFLAGFDDRTFDALPVTLLSGRMPENSGEILVPAHVASNGGVKISVGDTLTLAVGTRQAGGEALNQHDAYRQGEEMLSPVEKRTYRVVGICQRPVFEERLSPGYTLVTVQDTESRKGNYSTFVRLKKPGEISGYVEHEAEKHDYFLNDEVLRFMGLSSNKMFNTMLYSAGAVLIALVMLGSVFLIYNSFSISLNERTRQFGILMSVGATEKQLKNSVLFEGLCIGAVGIPIGILAGIPSIQLVLSLVNQNFSNILYTDVPLTLKAPVSVLMATVIISMVTILISPAIPARKAARMPVMECIRQTNEVTVGDKDVRTSKLAERIYGLEGTLALKSFKRNRRRYRSIILSLTLSMVLFVGTSSFSEDLKQEMGTESADLSYDISFCTQDMEDEELLALYQKMKTAEGVTESSCQALFGYTCTVRTDELSEAYREYEGKNLRDGTTELLAEVRFLDDDSWEKVIREMGQDIGAYTEKEGKLPVIARMEGNGGTDGEDTKPAELFQGSSVYAALIPRENGKTALDKKCQVELICAREVALDTPPYEEEELQTPYSLQILAPWSQKEELAPSDALVKGMLFQSEAPTQSAEQMQTMIEGESVTASYTIQNVYELLEQQRNILFVVNLFTGVFILMISLIAIANVLNTISTNIRLRRRELAMLRSVGMSDRDFNKMMRFECILYGVRTMRLGLPTAAILSWLIYRGLDAGGGDITFSLPWKSLAISAVGIFLAVFLSMVYATKKIRKENIIDALRDEMT